MEIHKTPDLSQCLDQPGNSGTELLELIDAGIYIPLTTYTQYKELLQPLQCPEQFTGNLCFLAPRHTKLAAAKQQVEALDDAGRALLVQKILRGADFELGREDVKNCYLIIAGLAVPLVNGPLMTKTAINLNGGAENLIVTTNLFQKSCQDAIAQINSPP